MASRGLQLFLLLLLWQGVPVDASELSDPLRPHAYHPVPAATESSPASVDTSEWRLSAVLISAQRSVAVINGRRVQPGDMLEGLRVMLIAGDRVELRNARQTVVLRRVGTGLKKISTNQDER